MKSRYSSSEAVALIQAERGLVKTIYSDHGHDEHWDFLLDQLADPENVRPIAKLDPDAEKNRHTIYDRYTGIETKRDIPEDHVRGAPKPGTENIKATAATLLPSDGKMRLYNHSNTARAYENAAILFDTGLSKDPQTGLAIPPKDSIVKHCYAADSGTVTKFWVKGQTLLSYHNGVRPKALPETAQTPAIDALRALNRDFSNRIKQNKQARNHFERNEVRIKPRSRDVFAVAALSSAGNQGNYAPQAETSRDDRINALHRKVYTMLKLKTDEGLPLEPGVVILDEAGVKHYPLLANTAYELGQVDDILSAMSEDPKLKVKNATTRSTHVQALIESIQKLGPYKPDFWEIIEAYRLFLFSECAPHSATIFLKFKMHYKTFIALPAEEKRLLAHEEDRNQRKNKLSLEKKKEEKVIMDEHERHLATMNALLKNKQMTEKECKASQKGLIKQTFDKIKAMRIKLNTPFLKEDEAKESQFQSDKRARLMHRVFQDEKCITQDRKAWTEIVSCVDQYNKKNIFEAYKGRLKYTEVAAIDKHFQTPRAYPTYRPKPQISPSATSKERESIEKQYQADLLKDHAAALKLNQFETGSHQTLLAAARTEYATPVYNKLIALGVRDYKALYEKMLNYLQEQTAVTFAFETSKLFAQSSIESLKILNVHEKSALKGASYATSRLKAETNLFSKILSEPHKSYFLNRETIKPRYTSFHPINHGSMPQPNSGYGNSFVVFHPHVLQNMLFVHTNALGLSGNLQASSFHHFEILLNQFSDIQLINLALVAEPTSAIRGYTVNYNCELGMEAYVPPLNILDNQVISHLHIDPSQYTLSTEEKALLNERGISFSNTGTNPYLEINKALKNHINLDNLKDFQKLLSAHPILMRLQAEPLVIQAMRAGSLQICSYLIKQKKQDPIALLPQTANKDWKNIVPVAKHEDFAFLVENPEKILNDFSEKQKIHFSLSLLDSIRNNDFSYFEKLFLCFQKLTKTQQKELIEFSHPSLQNHLREKTMTGGAGEYPVTSILEFESIQVGDKLIALDTSQHWLRSTAIEILPNPRQIKIRYDDWSERWDQWINYHSALTSVKMTSKKTISQSFHNNSNLAAISLILSLKNLPDFLTTLLENQFGKQEQARKDLKVAIETLETHQRTLYQDLLKKFDHSAEYYAALPIYLNNFTSIINLTATKGNEKIIQNHFKSIVRILQKHPELAIEESITLENQETITCFQFFIRYQSELPGLKAIIDIFKKAGSTIPLLEKENNLFYLAFKVYPEALMFLVDQLEHQAHHLSLIFQEFIKIMHEPNVFKKMKDLLKQEKIPLPQHEAYRLLRDILSKTATYKEYAAFQMYEKDLSLDQLAQILEMMLSHHKEAEVKRLVKENPGIVSETMRLPNLETLLHRYLDAQANRHDKKFNPIDFDYLKDLLIDYNEEKAYASAQAALAMSTSQSMARSILVMATEKKQANDILNLLLKTMSHTQFLNKHWLEACSKTIHRFEEEKTWDSSIINAFLKNPDISAVDHTDLIKEIIPNAMAFDRLADLKIDPKKAFTTLFEIFKLTKSQTKELRIQQFISQFSKETLQSLFNHWITFCEYESAEQLMNYAQIDPDSLCEATRTCLENVMIREFKPKDSFIIKLCLLSKRNILETILFHAPDDIVLERTQCYLSHTPKTLLSDQELSNSMCKLVQRGTGTEILYFNLFKLLSDQGAIKASNTDDYRPALEIISRRFSTFSNLNLSSFYHIFLQNPHLKQDDIQAVFSHLFELKKIPNHACLSIFLEKNASLDAGILHSLMKNIDKTNFNNIDSIFNTIEHITSNQKLPLNGKPMVAATTLTIMTEMIQNFQQSKTLLERFIVLLQKTQIIKLIENDTSLISFALAELERTSALPLLTPHFKTVDAGIKSLLENQFNLCFETKQYDKAELLYSLKSQYCDFDLGFRKAGKSSLHYAIQANRQDWIYRLVNEGVDFASLDENGKPAILLFFEPEIQKLTNGSRDPIQFIKAYQTVWEKYFSKQNSQNNGLAFHLSPEKKQALAIIIQNEISKYIGNIGKNLHPHQGVTISLDDPELQEALLQRNFPIVIAKFRQVEFSPGVRFDNRQLLVNNPSFATGLESIQYDFAFQMKDRPTPDFKERVERFNAGQLDKDDNFQDMLVISARLADLSPNEKTQFYVQAEFLIKSYIKSANLDLMNLKDDLAAKPNTQINHTQKNQLMDQAALFLITQCISTRLNLHEPINQFWLDKRVQTMENMQIVSDILAVPKPKIDKSQVKSIIKSYHHQKWHFFGHKSKAISQSAQSRKLLKDLENDKISEQEKHDLVHRFLVSVNASKTTLATVLKSELKIITPLDTARAKRLHQQSYKYRLRKWLKMPLISKESQALLDSLEKTKTQDEKYHLLINYLCRHSDKRLAKVFESILPKIKRMK